MAQQQVNIGLAPDDDTGDTLRAGGDKINDNFTELYNQNSGLMEQVTANYFFATDLATTRRVRIGFRDNKFVVDKELTATGFDGDESVDDGVTGDWTTIFYQA